VKVAARSKRESGNFLPLAKSLTGLEVVLSRNAGDGNADTQPAFLAVARTDMSFVQGHSALGDGQAQPVTATLPRAGFIGTVKRLEDILEVFLLNTRSCIRDFHQIGGRCGFQTELDADLARIG